MMIIACTFAALIAVSAVVSFASELDRKRFTIGTVPVNAVRRIHARLDDPNLSEYIGDPMYASQAYEATRR